MALNAESLASGIRAKVVSKNPEFDPKIGDDMDWLFAAIAEAVVEHVTANAQVSVTGVSGATACPAGAGTATGGVGAGTIS